MPPAPKLFTCPKCRHTYLGHDPLPDCPRCGYDYRDRSGFRWDVVVYLLAILGLVSFLLVSSSYRSQLGSGAPAASKDTRTNGTMSEKLPGSDHQGRKTFRTPYHESGQ